jgi:6-phosphogluconolactonase (cycloisomerase 2 family)
LYALTANDGITSFEVGDDGALEAMINGTLATGQAHRMLADPGGRYLFISDFIPGNIRPIAIDTRTGRLSLVPGGTIAGGNGAVVLTIVK